MIEQRTLTAHQFGAAAAAYLASPAHARGTDLGRLAALAHGSQGLAALDLGCGAGHAAYALAEGGAQVTAYDLAPEMLAVVEAEATRRGLCNLRTRHGPAERLSFPDISFDLVVSRYSAHHWSDVPAALAEVARVLKPGGTLIVIDVVAPETPLFDTLLQTVEILRDPSHVRDYRVSEWTAMLRAAGFGSFQADSWTLPAEFASWVARMHTPALRAEAVRSVWDQAPAEARAHFQVRSDGSFLMDVAWMQGRKAPWGGVAGWVGLIASFAP
ncbi:MAG TPA: class I SAM-dependent methyltransferase [Thiobacillaceae bacterium]|nr:class I SAM-dependent methyltransferase [Thiobacillaceae bacterium]HNU63283.1 class I SAM-dependent methyltransferase [Thiobacillaceae bacterium]